VTGRCIGSPNIMRTKALTIMLAATAGMLLLWSPWGQKTMGHSGAGGPASSRLENQSSQVGIELSTPSAERGENAQPAPEITAAEFLRDYPNGNKIAQYLRDKGRDIDSAPRPPPIEEAYEELAESFIRSDEVIQVMVDDLTSWNPEWSMTELANELRVDLSALDGVPLEQLHREAALRNEEIAAAGIAYMAELNHAIAAATAQGDMLYSPYTSKFLERPPHQGNVFYSSTSGYRGWSAKLELASEQWPELAGRRREIIAMTERRNRELREFIKNP
jgi:hypothetical protein